MKKFGLFALLSGLVLAAVYVFSRERSALIASAALCGMGYFGMTFKGQTVQKNEVHEIETLDNSSRIRIRPMTKLRDEIFEIMDSYSHHFVIEAMKLDVKTEVNSLLTHSIELVKQRKQTQSLMNSLYASIFAVQDLQEKLGSASDSEVIESTKAALQARIEEKSRYDDLEVKMNRLEASLDNAESLLAELKSKLVMTAANESNEMDELRKENIEELTMRLKSLSKTMEESSQIFSSGGGM